MSKPLTNNQKLVMKYIRILAFLNHESLKDIQRKTGKNVAKLVEFHPDSLPKYILYLSHRVYNELKLGDMGPFFDLIQQLSARVHNRRSFYTYVRVLAFIEAGSLAKVSKALGYKETYLGHVIKTGPGNIMKLCKPMASVMHVDYHFLTIPLHEAHLDSPEAVKLNSKATRQLIYRLIRLSAHAHHDTLSQISKQNGYAGQHFAVMFRRQPIDKIIKETHDYMPYLSIAELRKAKNGDREPFERILKHVGDHVDDRKSFDNYLTCVIYAHGTTAPKISSALGRTSNYIDSAERKGSKPALENVCKQIAEYLSIGPDQLIEPLERVKFSSKELGYSKSVTDVQAEKLRRRMLPVAKEVAKTMHVTPTQLSRDVLDSPKKLWMTPRYSIANNRRILRKLMKYSDKKIPNAERLLKDLNKYLAK